jgi:hypothetical protein
MLAYLNELPPEDASEFPVDTMMVKTVDIGPASRGNLRLGTARLQPVSARILLRCGPCPA